MSLWCNAALFALALLVLRRAGVELDLFHKAVLVGLWAAAVLYFYWTLGDRTFLYHWDYVNYILKQYHAEAAFAQSTGAGFRFFLDSITEDYTNFITLFTEFPFCLSGKTGDDYAFCQVFSVLPSLLVLLAGLTVKVGRMLRVKNRFWYFLIGFSWCATFPFVRMSAVLGQPDWFGLILPSCLCCSHWTTALTASTCPAICSSSPPRRGHPHPAVVLILCGGLLLRLRPAAGGIQCPAGKSGQQSRAVHRMVRLVVFGLCAAGAMVLLLLPMVRKILSFDYAGRYSYYNFGGITLELAAQTLRIGLLNFILIGMGLWFATKRRLPALPCLAGTELLVSLVLFTRVQNTGSHQMLLFVPGWLLLFLVGSAALADGLKKHTAVKLCYWGFTMVFAVSVRCSPLTTVALPGFVVDHFPLKAVSEFVRLDKLTYDRTDAAQIQRVDDWIDAHCDAEKGEFAYMIPHDMLYNSDIFQYAALPDIQLQGKLSAGISIPGTHEFPVRFFEAKYVLTAEPLPRPLSAVASSPAGGMPSSAPRGMSTLRRPPALTWATAPCSPCGERTEPADRAEVEYYLDAFAQEDALYPEMFSQVAEAWLAGHGL